MCCHVEHMRDLGLADEVVEGLPVAHIEVEYAGSELLQRKRAVGLELDIVIRIEVVDATNLGPPLHAQTDRNAGGMVRDPTLARDWQRAPRQGNGTAAGSVARRCPVGRALTSSNRLARLYPMNPATPVISTEGG